MKDIINFKKNLFDPNDKFSIENKIRENLIKENNITKNFLYKNSKKFNWNKTILDFDYHLKKI